MVLILRSERESLKLHFIEFLGNRSRLAQCKENVSGTQQKMGTNDGRALVNMALNKKGVNQENDTKTQHSPPTNLFP